MANVRDISDVTFYGTITTLAQVEEADYPRLREFAALLPVMPITFLELCRQYWNWYERQGK